MAIREKNVFQRQADNQPAPAANFRVQGGPAQSGPLRIGGLMPSMSSSLGPSSGNFGIKDNQIESQRFQFSPEIRAQLEGIAGGLPGLTQALQQQAGNMFTQFSDLTPQLNTQFGGPQFQTGLDATSRNLVSQGQQSLAQQAAQRGAAARRQFGGGVGDVLAQQAQAQSRIQQNPLLFQAAQQQRGREAQEFALQQQAQQLSNQALLAQAQSGIQGQQLQNQAMLQQGLIPLQAQQGLLGQFGNFAQLTGEQQAFTRETPRSAFFGVEKYNPKLRPA